MKEANSEKMMEKAVFAMAFHAFQPVFNFEYEVEKAFKGAYEPFLNVMEKFPEVKGTFHFSGNMLEWFEEKKPEYIEKLKLMMERGQIEIMGGGFFEPIMPVIPRRDALDQIRMMTGAVERIFGVKPQGAWTTERVWHRSLADLYDEEGIKYTILDDNHLLSSFVGDRGMFSPCVTCGDAGSVTVFPASTKLRYLMPFRPWKRTVDYMKNVTSRKDILSPHFFFADDLEKFGAWPRTYDHVYKRKWLENFFKTLVSESWWLKTATYSEMAITGEKQDVGVLQPASYPEMEEWCGGDFSNFIKKYPESGRMHGRMLDVSGRISQRKVVGDGSLIGNKGSVAKKELFKAQTNCPYWHGTFGGVYLPHLRSGVYSHIIRAEKILEETAFSGAETVFSAERVGESGTGESVLGNSHLKLYVNPAAGSCVEEIDLKGREINLVNSFSRQKEKYHRKLEKGYGSVIRKARSAALKDDNGDVDIHEILGVAEKGLGSLLAYDDYRRASFVTRVDRGGEKWDSFAVRGGAGNGFFSGKYSSETSTGKDLITRTFKMRAGLLVAGSDDPAEFEVVKELTLGKDPVIIVAQTVRNLSQRKAEITSGMEFNFLVWDASVMKGSRMIISDMVELKDRYSGLEIKFFMDSPHKVFMYPVYTINETECGLGKTFQGVCVVIGDDLVLGGRDGKKICAAIYTK